MKLPRDGMKMAATILGALDIRREYEWEWDIPPVGKKERQKLQTRAIQLGKIIKADFLNDAKNRLAAIEERIKADQEVQKRQEEHEAALKDFAESVQIADKLAAAALPEVARQYNAECRKLRKEIKRAEEKIRRHGLKVAKAKLARFKRP